MRVLTWNLFHGRSVPPTRHDLIGAFTGLLAGWSWDVALLQEVPPWWPPELSRACGAEHRTARTSRNFALALRRALARQDPELMKSNGGGSNAILARAPIESVHTVRLRTLPERRVAQVARMQSGIVIANFHGSTRVRLAEQELERLRSLALDAPGTDGRIVLGGDLNLRAPHVDGMDHAAARDVDHIFASGLAARSASVLDRSAVLDGRSVELSDHPPLLAELGPG